MSFRYHAPEALLDQTVRITIAGCGGTGSQFADALASLEVALRALGHPGFRVQLHDHDRVSAASIGRSRFTHADVGNFKAHLLCHRINIFYGLAWTSVPEHLHTHDIHTDVLVTCTDSAGFRAQVGQSFARRSTPTLWLDCGNGAAQAQCVLGHLGDPTPHGPRATERSFRLPNVFDLFPELASMQAADAQAPSCSVEEAITRQEWPINRQVAMAAATLLWNLFRKGGLDDHGVFIDTRTLTSRPLPIDPTGWSMFGYKAG